MIDFHYKLSDSEVSAGLKYLNKGKRRQIEKEA